MSSPVALLRQGAVLSRQPLRCAPSQLVPRPALASSSRSPQVITPRLRFYATRGGPTTPVIKPTGQPYRHHIGVVPLKAPWPWHESPASTSDTQVLTRTLYARPPDLNPSLLGFAAGAWALFFVAWILLPEPRKRELTEEENRLYEEEKRKTKEAGILAQLGLTVSSAIFKSAQPLIFFGVSAILTTFLIAATRIATRVNMVQIRPRDSTLGQGRTFLRVTNVGHEMLPGGKGRAREIRIEDCQLYIPNLDNPQTVRMRVTKPDGTSAKYSLDRFPYSLDLRDVKDLNKSNEEIVQSINRLEHVFGPVTKAVV